MIDVEKAIASAVNTGKTIFGAKEAIRSTKTGKAQLIMLSSHTEEETRKSIEYYAKLSSIPVVIYKGNNIDLGLACGKPHVVSAITIKEQGDSEILRLIETSDRQQEDNIDAE